MAILAKGQITLTTVSNGSDVYISINGGVRGIAYAADGTNPNPASSTPFTVTTLKNNREVKPISYKWACGGNLTGTSTSATFTPQISKTYQSGSSYVSVEIIMESGASPSTQTIPIVSTKNADGLDWLADWNNGKTTIKDKSIASPRIFAGVNESNSPSAPVLSGVAIGKDVLTGSNSTVGLVGYNKNNPVFKFDNKGEFLISPDGDAGKVVKGTGNGIYFDGKNLNISGSVVFRSGNQTSGTVGTPSSEIVDKANTAITKIDNLELGGINLLCKRTATLGKYLNSAGAEVSEKNWFYSDYISVKDIKNLVTSGYTNLGNAPSTCYYNADKKFIKGINNSNQSLAKQITIDSGVEYIRFSGEIKDMETLKLEKGLKPTSYSPCPLDVNADIIDTNNLASSANGLAEAANQKATVSESILKDLTKVESGATYIDGGRIYTNSITASSLNLYSGLTVTNKETGNKTFSIANNGDVEIDGILKSGNFSPTQNTGYRISPDGIAVLNQAIISGEFVMPNAGITNYGATIGNENLAMSSSVIERTTWKNISNDTFGSMKTFKPARATSSTVLSISFDIEYSDMIKSQSDADVYLQGSGDITAWNSGAWNGGPRLGAKINWGAGKGGSFNIKYQYTLSSDSIKNNHWFVGFRANFIQSGKFKMTNFKVEEGKEYTPWCPHKDEQEDYTRIWAGSHYATRDNAPFRVSQNGDMWASNATLSGRLLGDYDNGKVHIHDNQIVINDTSTWVDGFVGEIQNLTPLDASPNAHIVLGVGQSILNTDVIFGTNSDKRIEYLNSKRTLNLNSTSLAYSKGNTNIALDGAYWRGFRIGNNGGTDIAFGYTDGSWLGTAIMSHTGTRGSTYKDINIRRENYNEDVEVQVEGSLTIRTSVKGRDNKIEQRMVSDGWGWYSI